jgi:hypothetical protein
MKYRLWQALCSNDTVACAVALSLHNLVKAIEAHSAEILDHLVRRAAYVNDEVNSTWNRSLNLCIVENHSRQLQHPVRWTPLGHLQQL